MTSSLQMFRPVWRPAFFFIILVLSCVVISEVGLMTSQIKNQVLLQWQGARNSTFSEIEMTAGLLYPMNSSASNLARALSSYLNGTELSFAVIQTRVAPLLFQALSTIPQLSQVSYIGLRGLFFSFYNDGDHMFAVYSNLSSFSSKWYTQPVNRDTGKLYGDAAASDSMIAPNASWLLKALNSTSGYSSLETGWNKAQDSLFLSSVAMDGRGVVSLGCPTKIVADHFAPLDLHGGYFHLGTADGQVIVQTKLPNTQIEIYNTTVMVQTVMLDGKVISSGYLSCNSTDGKLRSHRGKGIGNKYKFYCSALDVAGVKSVYVLAFPRNGMVDLVDRNSTSSLLLLALVFVFIIVSLCSYIYLTARATNREMFLCAALIKQTEATQQAERKSMNKTKAYAGANHDVRGSLAAITGLIELCQEDANPKSELADHLVQMKKCTADLLGILNSILDMSKLEAGKMALEMEDFNLAQLLEDVVDTYYPLGMKKGIDIVLDPCDGSILKSPLVKGDRIRLKQIFCNLITNAIKFTSEGHISVRAVVKKTNLKKDIIASNRTTVWKFLSQFCYKNEDGLNDLDALHTVEENPNEMEFEFEVDDTGKGIPKDKQKSIFEDYVQVKETAVGQEGCGLGLGIVQSLVRVMKGELSIVEKESGERGTCFKFNIFLSTSGPESAATEEGRRSSGFHQHFPFISPKPEGSHVIIFIRGEERRKVLKKYIESLNIKVTIIKNGRRFLSELEKIKRRFDPSSFNSGKPEVLDYLSKSASSNSDPGTSAGIPFSLKDGSESTVIPHHKKTNNRISLGFMILVIDENADMDLSAFNNNMDSFRKDVPRSICKIVWLRDKILHHSRDQGLEGVTPEGDYFVHKPFHGSRLTQVLSLLPERKGISGRSFSKRTTGTTAQEVQYLAESDLSHDSNCSVLESDSPPSQARPLQQIVIHKSDEKGKDEKPLNGKKVLVVEDVDLLRRVITASLRKLGASVEVCTNGKEAFDQFCKALSDLQIEGDSKSTPYDYIFMDCEMPVMDGYEATRLIRTKEERYELHVPIIALTAHAMPEEASKSFDAGMDFHLTKPLQVDKLLNVIRSIDNH